MCSKTRIEGDCLYDMLMPCPLSISSSCKDKDKVISETNNGSLFALEQAGFLEALDLDYRKHVDMARQESAHFQPKTHVHPPKQLKRIP